jgi:glycosyltransferase involved in cell wall biosynthesis
LSEPAPSDTPSGRPEAPRLSILVPTWNAATTVGRALESVLEERRIPLEVVVVDDASTDGTADLVAGIAERDPRVVLLRLPANGGVSNARNRGLELVRGEWLAFVDADDLLFPGALDALMRPTADPTVRAVVGQRIQNNGERRWISKGYDNPDIRIPGRKSIATHPRLMYYASIHGKVFHHSLIRDLEFEGRVLGDQPWTIRALLRAGDRIEVIDATVYEWTHPHPDHWVETITSATKASAGRAAEMARMAPRVFAAVSDEVDAEIADPTVRTSIKRAYFERLVQSDLSGPVRKALDRRDPATADLFAAIGAFLATVPADTIATCEPLVELVLQPPGRRWRELVPSARGSYWTMLRPALRADRRMGRRIAWRQVARPALAVDRLLPPPVGPAAASAVLFVLDLPTRIRRRLRRR